MAEVHKRVEVEFENIEHVVTELPGNDLLPSLSSLEVAGVAALIHNFYNGIENILKQVVISCGKELPHNSSWHRDLVNIATSNGIISESTARELRPYLAFRHFFTRGYSFDLDKERIIPLVKGIQEALACFRDPVSNSNCSALRLWRSF
jgi:uncharacterized protein YutE (UPF0331/DUF86 family)